MKRFLSAVLRHETNTFSPVPTPLPSFSRASGSDTPPSGQAAIDAYRGTNNPVAAFFDIADQEGAEIVIPIAANAHPSAPTDAVTFEHFCETICGAVKAGCDAIFLDLHGAMVAEGFTDAEGELLRRIREITSDTPMAVALDFHTQMSEAMITHADVITGYRTYPHIDMYETGERAGRTLIRMMKGEVRPVMYWHSLPILSHTIAHTPSIEPMKSIMDKARAAEASGQVLNASIFGGFPMADIPEVGLTGVIVSDGEDDKNERLLYDLMSEAWDHREGFEFKVEPVAASIAQAKELNDGPVLLIDHGDNTGSGGNQDVMEVLRECLDQGLEDLLAGPISDSDAVEKAINAGVGQTVTLELGGKWDMPALGLTGAPLTITGKVTRITDGRFTITGPMMTGTAMDIGRTVLLDTGPAQIVISEGRYEPFDTGCFTHLGVDPATKRYVLLKSRVHFRAGFEPVAKEIIMVSGPGTTSSDFDLFKWKNVRRPIYPLDRDCPSNLPSQS